MKNILLIARFDLIAALRSRRVVSVMLLYLIGSLGGTAIFYKVISSMQRSIGSYEQWAKTLASNESFFKLVTQWVGDETVAKTLLNTPPLALFFGWLAISFIPFIVILNSSDAISSEIKSGSVRFAIFRVTRLSWVLGKLSSETALMTISLIVAAVGAVLSVGALRIAQKRPS